MKRLIAILGATGAAAVVLASPALAHLDPAEHGSLAAGFTHPLFGMDHLLAMVAVGLLAATQTGRAIYVLPLSFMAGMALGFLGALAGLSLPLVEPMILASGMILGGLIVVALRLPLSAAAGIVGFFGLFHGFAHGSEMGAAGVLAYALGFLGASALLHGAGLGFALSLRERLAATTGRLVLRAAGGVTAIWSAIIAFG